MNINDYQGSKGLQDVTFTLAPGGLKAFTGVGKLFQIVTSDGTLSIKTDKTTEATFQSRQGIKADDSALFERVEVTNRTGAAITARMIYGFGEFVDGQAQILGAVEVTSSTLPIGASTSAKQDALVETLTGSANTDWTSAQATKNIAVSGVPERLSAADLFCDVVDIRARSDNVGVVKYGYAAVAGTQLWELQPGEWKSMRAPTGKKINVKNIFGDAANNGDGFIVETHN